MSILKGHYPDFFRFVEEGKLPVGYTAKFREFHIRLNGSEAVQRLAYCPWSGKAFPASVRDRYYDLIEAAEEGYDRAVLVAKMSSETWWIDQNL